MRDLNSEALWKLLGQLDPNPELAGEKYETLRHKLMVFFEGRSCGPHSDSLADRTLDRVAAKLAGSVEIYNGSSLPSYCYGVARYVWKEWNAEKKYEPLEGDPAETRNADPIAAIRLDCLEKCLETLAPESRKLILDYYEGERGQKIWNRTRLAGYLGISQNAVRRRAHWIRVKQLEPCLRRCEEKSAPP
jgi:DNA-directed RNA polymerase specialized sigma24 family protein